MFLLYSLSVVIWQNKYLVLNNLALDYNNHNEQNLSKTWFLLAKTRGSINHLEVFRR